MRTRPICGQHTGNMVFLVVAGVSQSRTSLRSAYVRAYGDHDLRNMSSLFIRDPSAMGFAQGEYVFRASSRTAADKREANMRSSMRRLPIPVGGSRSAFYSGCNITTARPNADRPICSRRAENMTLLHAAHWAAAAHEPACRSDLCLAE